jgi:nucleoside-diphosphate-sugar epimerase
MRILVIGGTRFIGPPVVRRLDRLGHDVTVFHRGETEADLPSSVRHLHGDRQRLFAEQDQLRQLAPEAVIDMGAMTEADAQAVVDAVRGIVRRLVVISSQDVYRAHGRFHRKEPGPLEPVPLTEDSPVRTKLHPYRGRIAGLDDYDKILVERVALSAADLPATGLRLPAVYGEGDYQHRLALGWPRSADHGPDLDPRPLDTGRVPFQVSSYAEVLSSPAEENITRGLLRRHSSSCARSVAIDSLAHDRRWVLPRRDDIAEDALRQLASRSSCANGHL